MITLSRGIIKKYYKESKYIRFVLKPLLDLFSFITFYLISDEIFLKWLFLLKMGYKLDLKNPVTINEKIQWLKLYNRSALHTNCADKYAVRDFIKSQIGDQYLIPLVLCTEDINVIRPENFPDYPVSVKANHNSGSNIVIWEKSKIDWIEIRKICKGWLKNNYYQRLREWQYKDIKPKIVVEKLLLDQNSTIPYDYKFQCFNGKVVTIQVDTGRGTIDHHRFWYNRDWVREPFKWPPIKNEKLTNAIPAHIDKPDSLEVIISLSEKLAKNFIYVRVDWYIVKDAIFFGELTFHHDGGFGRLVPEEWDRKLGDLLKLIK